MKNVYVNIRMSETMKQNLTELAHADNRSLSSMICLLLAEKTEKRTQIKNERTQIRNTLELPEGVSDQTWADFKALRNAKKAPITARAIEGIANEAMKAGVTLEAALRECCSRGWTGFKAEWTRSKQDEVAALLKPSVPYLEM
jgi:hypothetical protein